MLTKSFGQFFNATNRLRVQAKLFLVSKIFAIHDQFRFSIMKTKREMDRSLYFFSRETIMHLDRNTIGNTHSGNTGLGDGLQKLILNNTCSSSVL